MSDYEYTKYITTKDTIRETVEKYGVAILPQVLDSSECEGMMKDTSHVWRTFA